MCLRGGLLENSDQEIRACKWMREGDIKSQHMQSCKHDHKNKRRIDESLNVMSLEKEGSDTSHSQDTSGSGSDLSGL